MPINELSSTVQYVMDLLGIFAFALTGAFIAVRKDFDIVGTIILSAAAGLGGGLFRDSVIGVRPAAFTDLGYFFTPVAAATIVFFGLRLTHDSKITRSVFFDVSDAAALGLFSVTGTIKALEYGLNTPAATTLGSASAVGGGVLASVLAMEVPSLLRWDRDLYALPALFGAGATAALHATGVLNVLTAVSTAVIALALRMLALHYRWRSPRSHFWRTPFAGLRQHPTGKPAPSAGPSRSKVATVAINPIELDTLSLGSPRGPHSGEHRRSSDPRITVWRQGIKRTEVTERRRTSAHG
ncbi:trimeric intracellular cation channel family protein [Streptomyces sp. NPDC048663]|uniref:trimeric intracellular cation channel family protein n=1 Tax=Streptomyces sp. NPDC048663 TaxID=3155638 RepID=UPI0034462807